MHFVNLRREIIGVATASLRTTACRRIRIGQHPRIAPALRDRPNRKGRWPFRRESLPCAYPARHRRRRRIVGPHADRYGIAAAVWIATAVATSCNVPDKGQ
jgi:hypothetical protein